MQSPLEVPSCIIAQLLIILLVSEVITVGILSAHGILSIAQTQAGVVFGNDVLIVMGRYIGCTFGLLVGLDLLNFKCSLKLETDIGHN